MSERKSKCEACHSGDAPPFFRSVLLQGKDEKKKMIMMVICELILPWWLAVSRFQAVETETLCNFDTIGDTQVVLNILPVADGELVIELLSNTQPIGAFSFSVVGPSDSTL